MSFFSSLKFEQVIVGDLVLGKDIIVEEAWDGFTLPMEFCGKRDLYDMKLEESPLSIFGYIWVGRC